MPRTKIVKKRRVTQAANGSCVSINQNEKNIDFQIEEVKNIIEAQVNLLRYEYNRNVMKIKQIYKKARMNLIQTGLGNKTLKEIMTTDLNDFGRSSNKENEVCNKIQLSYNKSGASLKTKSYQRSLRKRSNSCSSRATKKTLVNRSASCDRVNKHIMNSVEKFKTPCNRNTPITMVTPKVNPNVPLSVLRRPRQGEFAMSISGSPLMVSGVAFDDMASVSVPLPDGRVLSILPTEGIDSTNLHLDDFTRKQLIKLRSNLTKCLSKT